MMQFKDFQLLGGETCSVDGCRRIKIRATDQGPLCLEHWIRAGKCAVKGCDQRAPFDGLCRDHHCEFELGLDMSAPKIEDVIIPRESAFAQAGDKFGFPVGEQLYFRKNEGNERWRSTIGTRNGIVFDSQVGGTK